MKSSMHAPALPVPNRHPRLLLVCLLLQCSATLANPGTVPLHGVRSDHQPLAWMSAEEARAFPRYDSLEPAVRFWIRVFAEFSEDQSVIHWAERPEVILEVLDFSRDVNRMSSQAFYRHRGREEQEARDRNERLLREIHAARHKPDSLSPHARQVYDRFSHISDDRKFLAAADKLRSQRGLRERTQQALEIAGHYLPEMERIFDGYGLPRLLTRLPILESSFNVNAYSKVGAAGLWQFIPSSARIYMRYDEIADQRRDPWTSTDAAARHLVDDMKLLKSWPLALTAYNHGRAGIARGLRETGGRTIEDLVWNYRTNRFGFASRNFYAEFLAVIEIDHHRDLYFGKVKPRKPITFATVKTNHYMEYSTLRRLSGAGETTFRKLNPAFSREVQQDKILVPPQYVIRVPAGKAAHFNAGYAQLAAAEKFDRQRDYFIAHRVRSGETIGRIAQHYRVSERAIVDANGLRDKHRIRIGQSLKIPPRGGSSATTLARVETVLPAPAAKTAAPAAAAYRLHRVQAGQTLWNLARRYGTTVNELRRLNNLNSSAVLPVGMRLKVPGATTEVATQDCKADPAPAVTCG